MKTLYIVRHAKAEEAQPGLADFDRKLTHRGEDQAEQVSKILHKQLAKVDVILASPAARALATAQIIAQGIHYPINQIRQIPDMYEASVNGLLDIISNIKASYKSAMLVGHNPTITSLAQRLSSDVNSDLSTCTVIVLTFNQQTWDDVIINSGTLINSVHPK